MDEKLKTNSEPNSLQSPLAKNEAKQLDDIAPKSLKKTTKTPFVQENVFIYENIAQHQKPRVRVLQENTVWEIVLLNKNNLIEKWFVERQSDSHFEVTSNDKSGNKILTIQHALFDILDTERRDWWSGKARVLNLLATTTFCLACFYYAVFFLMYNIFEIDLKNDIALRANLLAMGTFLTVLPHIWIWLESIAFFEWSKAKYTRNPDELKEERDKFKQHLDFSKAIWLIFSGFLAYMFYFNIK